MCAPLRALMLPARVYVYVRERASEPRFHGCFRSLRLTVRQSEGARREREGERDGEIMGMEGERRLTQSLMSFLGSLCLFLGQGPLAEDVGGGLWSREDES